VWRKIQFLADGFEEKNYYFLGMHDVAGEREREREREKGYDESDRQIN
jgi:hypothetical protein